MNAVFAILCLPALMGAFDNLWHHELLAPLPRRAGARRELALHAAREAIHGLLFAGLAWLEWRGAFAALPAGLLAAELAVTVADFVEEDRTRRLPPLERVLHAARTTACGLFAGVSAPVLLAWGRLPTGLAPISHGAWSWLFTLCALGLSAWCLRNTLAARRLAREAQTPRDFPAPAPLSAAVLVTGGTGFVGRAVVESLRREGRRVIVLSRDARQARGCLDSGVRVVESLDEIDPQTRIAAVVNLAGARVLGLPWTAGRRAVLLGSRVDTTVAVVALMRRLAQPPRVLVSASGVGFYGGTQSFEALDETAAPRPGQFQSDLCIAIEHEARRAEALGVRVVRLRLGVVLGRRDGAFPMLALAARCGLGAVLGSGRQAVSWIHLEDAIGLVRFALAHEGLSGAVNAVAPDLPRQADFTRTLAAAFGRRAVLRVPHRLLRAALGEMAEMMLEGQRVLPRAASAAGYVFRYPRLDGAVASLVGSGRDTLARAARAL